VTAIGVAAIGAPCRKLDIARLSRPGALVGPDRMTTQTVYRVTTAVITGVMLFSLYKMFSPEFAHLGFPAYLRTELVVAKCLVLVVLVLPRAPLALKEWAYAGFAIVLVSASIAHLCSGDGVAHAMEPLGFLVILLISHRALHRLRGQTPG
jgi:DoxX-like protein